MCCPTFKDVLVGEKVIRVVVEIVIDRVNVKWRVVDRKVGLNRGWYEKSNCEAVLYVIGMASQLLMS